MTRLLLPIIALLALPLAPQGAQCAPSTSVTTTSDDALTAFAAARHGSGGGKSANADRGANAKNGGKSNNGKNANAKSTDGKNTNARNTNAKNTDVSNTNAKSTNAKNANLNNTNAKNTNAKNTNLSNTNAKSTNAKNTNVHNTNVNNTNVNAAGAGSVAVVSPVRPWVPKPYYGTVVAGVSIGTLIAVSTIPSAPSSQLCWYWANSSQTQGYWDYCQ